jgi:neurofibromin 1
VFLHLKRAIQPTIASILRSVIWNWIDNYPGEFIALVESNRKLEGGADVLFDTLHSLAESDPSSSSSASMSRLKAIYPAMTALLVVCPDVLKKAAIAEVTGGRLSPAVAKKVHYLETLRKAARSTKMAEIVLACYVDLAKGAVCLPGRLETSGLRSLLPGIRPDIKVGRSTVESDGYRKLS